jgi:hypothetical protein
MSPEAGGYRRDVHDTDEELRRLTADSVPPGTCIRVSHFFSQPGASIEEVMMFLAALRAAGFGEPSGDDLTEVDTDEELEGDRYWHHWAYSIFPADELVLRKADSAAGALATKHGVRYDGWKVQRGHDDRDGPPRVVE